MIFLQAIQVKRLPPTNTKYERLKAFAKAGSLTVPFNHVFDTAENYFGAAQKLQLKFGWDEYNLMHGGVLPNGDYCFVQVKRETK